MCIRDSSLLLLVVVVRRRSPLGRNSTPNRRHRPLVQCAARGPGDSIESHGGRMNKLSLSIVASSLAFSFSASAQENQLPTEAFLGAPSDGRVVMDTYGNCVRTSQWSMDLSLIHISEPTRLL